MSTDGANADDIEGIQERLARFEHDARQSLARLEGLQAQIDELLTVPDPVATRAELSAQGRLTHLAIDPVAARDMSVENLEYDINLAIAEAAKRRPPVDVEQAPADVVSGGVDLMEWVNTIFSGPPATDDAAPEPTWNEERTVAVTVHAGLVQRVECDHQWMRRSAPHAIAAQIVAVADHAWTSAAQEEG